ncbi:restriction endonuclease subunit S [Lacrimispora sp.]|uniref:restriction endonuclease subunit S n=1 Tax=Lacrimispora sp. TaxID=2719234 RepID=UPI0028A63335|nr:restriction endonuclease subunit S [Lacrimispora sp.]
MNDKDTKVPEIRFQGFTDAWEQRKLGEDIKFVGGATPFKANSEYWNGDIVWLSSQEIKESFVTSGTYKITKKAVQDNATKVIKAGTPLIVTRSGILAKRFPISIPTVDVAINQDIKALIYDNERIRTDFLVAGIQRNEGFILKYIVKSGTTVQSISLPDFQKFLMSYPMLSEQIAIGNFFRILDDAITLHKRKLDGLKELKRGYLQRMFPQAGQSVPQVRLAGFTEPWQKRLLGDVVDRVTRKNKGLESTLVLTISAQHGLIAQKDFFDKEVASKDVSNYYLVKNGEFAYNKSYSNGYPWGAIKRLDNYEIGVLSTLYIVFKPTNIDSEFLTQYYETTYWHNEVSQYAAEGARNHGLLNISTSDFFDTVLTIPTDSDEQATIGNFFRMLDGQIITQKQKLSQIKQLKSAYLQKMFI